MRQHAFCRGPGTLATESTGERHHGPENSDADQICAASPPPASPRGSSSVHLFCNPPAPHPTGMGRILVLSGLFLVVAGLLITALSRFGLPLGRLPGDLAFRGKHIQIFAPLGTSLLLSLLLSLILYALARFRH